MHEVTLFGIVAILTLGILAQWLAWRIQVPSILILLFAGFLIGPATNLIHPDALLGDLLFPLVSIAVAIILFEGGLSLKIADLAEIGSAVRNLILIGVPVTMFICFFAAKHILQIDQGLALLIGAILVVTGPTVIMPMLKSVHLSDRVGNILRWEAMLNDCIGAILAILVFESIISTETLHAAGGVTLWLLVKTTVIGIGMGFVSVWIMLELLKRYWVPDFLHSVFTLMMVVLTFTLSNLLQEESGLIAVTMAGAFLANQKKTPVKHIVEFKENLTILAVSGLFIILASRLKLEYITNIGWREIGFLIFMILIGRPLPVMISTLGTGIPWREKIFLSGMAPRGIVAAAVGSIFALKLEAIGYPDADRLLAIIFLVIMSTVIFYGLSASPFAKQLRLVKPNPQGILFLGAHAWARKIAGAVQAEGFHVLLADTNDWNVYEAHLELLPAVRINVLDEGAVDELNLLGIGRLLAMTPNDQVNAIASTHMVDVFARSEVYQLYFSGTKRKDVQGATKRAHGRFLFQKEITFSKLTELFSKGAEVKSTMLTKDYNYGAYLAQYGDAQTPLFLVTDSSELKIMTVEHPQEPKVGHILISLIHGK